jgi:hypothetical protein
VSVKYLRAARNELRNAIKYYNGQKDGLGIEFLSEVQATVKRIKQMPNAWHPIDNEIRRCQTKRFPYGVIYLLESKTLMIVAIAHLHREPDYWRNRL